MRSRRTRSGGFTLIEAALVIIIIGTGVVSMMELMATGTRANSVSAERVTALTLARNVREHALTLSYDQVRALSGHTYSPPIDADGAALARNVTSATFDTAGDAITLRLTIGVDGNTIELSGSAVPRKTIQYR